MKRVYLDQNHWITLARTAVGRDRDPKRINLLALILYSVDNGLASFPLSSSHYVETLRRSDPRSRQELGNAMHQISKCHTMAGINDLLRPEAAAVLARWHGLPAPPEPRVFGIGLSRAVSLHGREVVDEFFEESLIMGPAERLPDEGMGPPSREWSQRQLDGERTITQRLIEHGHTPELGRGVVMVEEGIHAINVVNDLAAINGVPPVQPKSREDVEGILFGMPSKAALTRMRMSAHENSGFKWEIGDLGDLTGLAPAAAYCDIVVARKSGDRCFNVISATFEPR